MILRYCLSICLLYTCCPLQAQTSYEEQLTVINEMLLEKRYRPAAQQAEALVGVARQAKLAQLEADALMLHGQSLFNNPAGTAESKVEGVRQLQAAATLHRRLGNITQVDSISTLLAGADLPAEDREEETRNTRRERRRAILRRLPSADSLDESALNAIVNLQKKEIMALTDSQLRQMVLLEQKDRLLDNYAFKALQDSVELLRQDQQLESQQMLVAQEQQRRNFLILLAVSIAVLSAALYWRFRSIQARELELEEQNELIRQERQRSEELLLNILPAPIAAELKDTGKATTRYYASTTVLFLDFQNFSAIAKDIDPTDLIAWLDEAFSAFDEIVKEHGVEKIKTIGDAYMCAGGLPIELEDHAERCVKAALAMQSYLKGNQHFIARIGLHSGPVVAGVVGSHKFVYDVWGDTVNQASRLESACTPGRVAISGATKALLPSSFELEEAGTFDAKNIGPTRRYYLT